MGKQAFVFRNFQPHVEGSHAVREPNLASRTGDFSLMPFHCAAPDRCTAFCRVNGLPVEGSLCSQLPRRLAWGRELLELHYETYAVTIFNI